MYMLKDEDKPKCETPTLSPATPSRKARGFASMDVSKQREIASKGGQAVSRNRQHMAEIGRKGGQTVSQNRAHMAEIGRKGGSKSRQSPGGTISHHPL